MALDSDQRYDADPPIPSYDEAVAGGSWQRHDPPHSPIGDAAEGQSLLNNRHHLPSANNARRPGGYRAPTVETDDEDSLLGSDTDSDSEDEAEQVRREMQEMDIDDSATRGGRGRSSWGKRIGFTLPQWRWRPQWRLPQIRLRRTPAAATSGDGAESTGDEQTPGSRFAFPTLGSTALFLIVGRVLAIMLVLGFLYLLFVSDMFTNMARRMGSRMFDPASVRNHVKMSVDPRRIRETLKHYTGYAHIAGTAGDFALAEDTETLFKRYGLEDVTMDEYQVYLNYPKPDGRAVEILGADGKPTWSAKLEEDEHGGEVAGRQTLAFHGHSKSGDVKGPLIFANNGLKEDFAKLTKMGIDTHGAIALVRYGEHPSDVALKVKEAELAGFAGCLVFNDPADDGSMRSTPAPQGGAMPDDGVHRAGVSLTSYLVGDVLTPGWGSKEGAIRVAPSESLGLVKIPSLPLAWRDAEVLIKHIANFGEEVPPSWKGQIPNRPDWWTGNVSSPIVRLKNHQDEIEKKPIWNVYGRITGIEQSEKKVIIGNHRDAWSFGGPDPNSGTAIMMEVIRIFGDLMAQEWRPLRTIEFMSWDGGAYNLMGSTEYVEQNDEDLRNNGLAYINIGAGADGSSFRASGSPILYKALLEVLGEVEDPNHEKKTLRDLWDERHGELEGLGGGSDFVAFQDIVGMSSIDMRFGGDHLSPAGSSYSNFDFVEHAGDPGYVYHTLLAQAISLLILELADRPIMPFDLPHYTDTMQGWIQDLESWLKSHHIGTNLSIEPLLHAHREIIEAVREFTKWELSWETSVVSSSGFETAGLGRKRAEYNNRLARFESDMLDPIGLHQRSQYKHVLGAPSLENRYKEETFPSIRDAVNAGDYPRAKEQIQHVADIMKQAAARLLE